jgi:glutamyl-tRNA synthetase
MYQAFKWFPPAFAHVGLLTDQNHQKLSKRNMDIDITTFRDKMGIFPETLTNFVALLGWSHQKRNDVMNLQELMNSVRYILPTYYICIELLAVYYEIYYG